MKLKISHGEANFTNWTWAGKEIGDLSVAQYIKIMDSINEVVNDQLKESLDVDFTCKWRNCDGYGGPIPPHDTISIDLPLSNGDHLPLVAIFSLRELMLESIEDAGDDAAIPLLAIFSSLADELQAFLKEKPKDLRAWASKNVRRVE